MNAPAGLSPALAQALANPVREARLFWARLLAPPPMVDYAAWASRAIVFGADAPFPGAFDLDRFPYWRRPLACLAPGHPARVVTIKKSAQLGGTVLGDVFVGGSLDLDPGPVLVTHPTVKQGELWLKNKFRAHIRNSLTLKRIFPLTTSRDSKNTADYLERFDQRGHIQVSGANSSQSLSQHSNKRQVQDDLSKWENNENGDPESQADMRSGAYPYDAKILKISTATIYGNCRITRNYERGTQEQFHVPCPHCGHEAPFVWDQMRAHIDAAIDGKASGEDPLSAAIKGAHFTCAQCGGLIEEHHRDDMVAAGRWVADNPQALEPSFYIWSAYSRLKRWSLIAVDWAKARGLPEKEQAFLNDTAGLAYRVDCETPEWTTLRDRALVQGVPRGQIPMGLYLLAAGVDCQQDRVEVGIWAFGPHRRRAAIEHIVLPGSIANESTKQALTALLKEWRARDAYGNPRAIEALAIDAGYETEHVTQWVALHGRTQVMAVRGASSDNAPSIGLADASRVNRMGKRVKKRSMVFWVGQSILKMWLYADLKKADPLEPNSVGLPQGMSDDWFAQLTAEQRLRKRDKRGYEAPQWVLPAGQRNEVLDCAVYAHAAAEHLLAWKRLPDHGWAALAAERDRPPPPDKAQPDLFSGVGVTEAPKPAAEPAPAVKRRKPGGWISGRR